MRDVTRHGHMAVVAGLALLTLVLGAAAALVAVDLSSYQRLTAEATVAEVRFHQEGRQRFSAEVLYPDAAADSFDLAGDEWQLRARVIEWHGPATRIGLAPVFRVDRIAGRYRGGDDTSAPSAIEWQAPRPHGVDLWRIVHALRAWLPWIDAVSGNGAYLPMADGAHFAVTISPDGLVAHPLNRPAVRAVSAWH